MINPLGQIGLENGDFKTDDAWSQTRQKSTRSAALSYLMLLCAGAAVAVFIIYINFVKPPPSPISGASPVSLDKLNPFLNLSLEAKAAYVVDTTTGAVLYEKNAEAQLPLASLTKLMTALVAVEVLPDYSIVPIGVKDIEKEGDSGFAVNEPWRLKDIVWFTLLSSSNDGASALANSVAAFENGLGGYERASTETVMENKMNDKAKEIGLIQTYFTNETGLDSGKSVSGGYGSARDMTKLFNYILRNHRDLLEVTAYDSLLFISLSDKKREAKNTNALVKTVPGIIASKTGFTDLAGGNLVVAFDLDFSRPIIAAVLGSSEEGRFADVSKIIDATALFFANGGNSM